MRRLLLVGTGLLLVIGCGGGGDTVAPPPLPPPPPPPSGQPTGSVLLVDQSLPASGGTISYHKSGDPLDGLTLKVPGGAYSQGAHWKLTAYPQLKANLPAGAIQFGGGIEIGNDQGYADSLVSIRIPVAVGLDTALAAFFYDPGSGYLEVLPTAARDASSLTVVTPHVRGDYLWKPRSLSGAPSATASVESFGSVKLIVTGIPRPALKAPQASGFQPGTDDWEFANYGAEITPNGSCTGMSITAMYYFERIKPTSGKSLFRQYDRIPNFDWDNPQGIRFAAMVQYIYRTQFDVAVNAFKAQMAALAQQSAVPLDLMMYQTLVVALWVTKQPQLFTMDNGPNTDGHAVVAYASQDGVVWLADPNQPGTVGVNAIFINNHFEPVTLEPIYGAGTKAYSRVFVPGTSTYIPTPTLDAQWTRFQGGVAGNGTFTPLYFDWSDDPQAPFQILGDSATTWGNSFSFGATCPSCNPTHFLDKVADLHGTSMPNPGILSVSRRDSLGVWATLGGKFVDFKWTLAVARFFDLTGPTSAILATPVKLTGRPFGNAPPGARYVWDFRDGTPPLTVVGDSAVTHSFVVGGDNWVRLELRDAAGNKLAVAVKKVTIQSKLVLGPFSGLIDTTYNIVARGILPNQGSDFKWTFGDGSAQLVTSDTMVQHRYSRAGNYLVKVVARDVPSGTPFDSAQMFVRIYPGEWRISNLTLIKTSPTKPAWLAGANKAFNDSLTYYLQRLEQSPSDGMLFFADDSLWREHGVYFQIAPPGTGGGLLYWKAGSQVWMVARESTVLFSHFSNTGRLWDGSIDGAGYTTLFSWPTFTFEGEFLNFITATKEGKTLRGTLRFTLYDGTTTPAERAYTFVAQLVP